jgi:hypothetical protein
MAHLLNFAGQVYASDCQLEWVNVLQGAPELVGKLILLERFFSKDDLITLSRIAGNRRMPWRWLAYEEFASPGKTHSWVAPSPGIGPSLG